MTALHGKKETPNEQVPRAKAMATDAEHRRLDKAIDELYRGEDRQEELIDIICQCFYNEQTTRKN